MSGKSSRRPRKWLRSLGWVSLALLALAFTASVAHWWWARQTHAVAERVRATTPPLPVRAGGKSAAPEREPVPPEQLPLVGPALTGDAAAAEALEQRFEEVVVFFRKLANGRLDHPVSYLEMLRSLGLPVTAGMTEKEAAAAFLAAVARFDPLLAEWRADLEKGPWSAGEPTLSSRHGVLSPAVTVARLLWLTTGAQLLTGDSDGAWRSLETMALTAERMSDMPATVGYLVAVSVQALMTRTIADGLLTGGFTDTQLRALPALVGRFDPFASVIDAVEGDSQMLDRSADALVTSPELRQQLAPIPQDWLYPLRAAASELFTSPQQIHDSMDLAKAAALRGLDPIDFSTRNLRPNASSFRQPLLDQPLNWFGQYYYRFAMPMFEGGDIESYNFSRAVVQAQSRMDQAAIASRLELEKRATGAYPATLPADSPHDPATGQPYVYRLTDDGDYELRGAGLNQADDGGDAKEDIVWPRRSRKTAPAASGVAAGQ